MEKIVFQAMSNAIKIPSLNIVDIMPGNLTPKFHWREDEFI